MLSKITDDALGVSAVAVQDIPADERVLALPFELAVTPALARTALQELLHKECEGMEEKDLIAGYLVLHWVWEDRVTSWVSLFLPCFDPADLFRQLS